jgi:hypothetical protein
MPPASASVPEEKVAWAAYYGKFRELSRHDGGTGNSANTEPSDVL